MGSVGFGEIAFIAIVALLVFGPDRLPELARKAGELMTKAREATRSFTDAFDGEFGEATGPIRSLKADFEATKDELRTAAGTVMDLNLDVTMGDRASSKPSEDKTDSRDLNGERDEDGAKDEAGDQEPDQPSGEKSSA